MTRRDPTGLTQVLAANVDLVLVAVPADRMSLARVEREVAVGWDSGAQPVVLMTKSDLDTGEAVQQLSDRLVGVDIIRVSSVTGDGAASVSRQCRSTAGTAAAVKGLSTSVTGPRALPPSGRA